MRRKFVGEALRYQDGTEQLYVSDLPDTYDAATGENLDTAGVFQRVELSHGTKAELLQSFTGDLERNGLSAEAKANNALVELNEKHLGRKCLGNLDHKDYEREAKSKTKKATDK